MADEHHSPTTVAENIDEATATAAPGPTTDGGLRVSEVVERWGKADTTVRRDIRKGRLKATELDGVWSIDEDSVVALYGPEAPDGDEDRGEIDQLRSELEAARAELIEAQHRADLAETALAGERAALEGWKAAADIADTLRQITPAITALATQANLVNRQMIDATSTTPKRRWWQRSTPETDEASS